MSCTNCVKNRDYETENLYTWCTNCGNYGINGALRRALVEEDIAVHEVVLCFDVGCNGNGSDKIDGYRVHGLHGRVIPLAVGAALANQRLPVIASAGDGATLGEGINHLIHAVRSNYNITFILHNNSNFGLTTGQASPATPDGIAMNSSPDGVTAAQLNAVELVLACSPTFVARGFSGNIEQMVHLMREGLNHNGFSFIEILQDCPTYNKATPHEWYMERIYDIGTSKDYDSSDIEAARKASLDLTERIATGILYRDDNAKSFIQKQTNRVETETALVDEVNQQDISALLARFS